MTMVRSGLFLRIFLQRKGPGNEPGNSLWYPGVSLEAAVLLYGVLGALIQYRAELIAKSA